MEFKCEGDLLTLKRLFRMLGPSSVGPWLTVAQVRCAESNDAGVAIAYVQES